MYFGIQPVPEFQNAIVNVLGLVMTAFAVLLTIFGRRVFIVMFWREKNVVNFHTQQPSQVADNLDREGRNQTE